MLDPQDVLRESNAPKTDHRFRPENRCSRSHVRTYRPRGMLSSAGASHTCETTTGSRVPGQPCSLGVWRSRRPSRVRISTSSWSLTRSCRGNWPVNSSAGHPGSRWSTSRRANSRNTSTAIPSWPGPSVEGSSWPTRRVSCERSWLGLAGRPPGSGCRNCGSTCGGTISSDSRTGAGHARNTGSCAPGNVGGTRASFSPGPRSTSP